MVGWSNNPWKACAATLNVHLTNLVGGLYILIGDIILNYDSITYEAMFAVLVAVVGTS